MAKNDVHTTTTAAPRRWYAVTLVACMPGGDLEVTLDIRATNPGSAAYEARGILAHDEHISQSRICTERVAYNDLRTRSDG